MTPHITTTLRHNGTVDANGCTPYVCVQRDPWPLSGPDACSLQSVLIFKALKSGTGVWKLSNFDTTSPESEDAELSISNGDVYTSLP